MQEVYCVTQDLPHDDQMVMAFGHKTFCCGQDMEKVAEWHRVRFRFRVHGYRLKRSIPKDPEESILDSYEVYEQWDLEDDEVLPYRVIGVTKWKELTDYGYLFNG